MANPRSYGRTNAPLGLGSANMDDRAIKVAVAADQPVARNDQVYAIFQPTAGGIYEVRHNLQRIPQYASLWEVVAGPAADLEIGAVVSVRKPLWTVSTVQVRISAVAGSFVGSSITLIVG